MEELKIYVLYRRKDGMNLDFISREFDIDGCELMVRKTIHDMGDPVPADVKMTLVKDDIYVYSSGSLNFAAFVDKADEEEVEVAQELGFIENLENK